MFEAVTLNISPSSRYILSTSGRIASLKRYQHLLQNILHVDIAYLPFHSLDIEEKVDPIQFCWALKGMPCIGGAISKDIKQSIVALLDELDDSARGVNSVNTVIRRGNILKGYNTDIIGFQEAIENGLKRFTDLKIKSIVIYGYGGVTNVAAYVMKRLGMDVYITGRREEMVIQKAAELDIKVWSIGMKVDMFVNAAPVSNSDLSQVTNFVDALIGCSLAFDHELKGQCLEDYCLLNNIRYIKGTEMYRPQMIAQWKLFLENEIDTSNLESILDALS